MTTRRKGEHHFDHGAQYLKALIASFLILFLSAGCTYGPERMILSLENAEAKPNSHELAIAIGYKVVKDATGIINTFPNGGVPKTLYREARIYKVNVDKKTVVLVAQIPNYEGIPPYENSVQINGWSNGKVYFSLIGYGGNQKYGTDKSDEHIKKYAVSDSGGLVKMKNHPHGLERNKNTGPIGTPPFLRLSNGHLSIDIGVDDYLSKAIRKAKISFDPETGKPYFALVKTKYNKVNSANTSNSTID